MFFTIYAAQCSAFSAEVKLLPVEYCQRPLCQPPYYELSVEMVQKMVDEGLIIVSSKGTVTKLSASGRACMNLYLIKDGEENRYVLKETSDPDELQGIIDARALWPHGLLSKEGYSLALAFHEYLWTYEDQEGQKHDLELLNAARGCQLNDYLRDIFPSLLIKGDILDKRLFQREDCDVEEGDVRVTTSSIIPKSSIGDLELNLEKLQEAIEAYKAFGTMIGALFAQYPCLDAAPPLDIHDGNVFYEFSTRVVTLIDLQKLGEALRQEKKRGLAETLSYVFSRTPLLNKDELNEFFFAGVRLLYDIRSNRFTWNSTTRKMELERCVQFPDDHPTRIVLFRFLNNEFNKMWTSIDEIRKAFARGLMSNFSKAEDVDRLRHEFKKFDVDV